MASETIRLGYDPREWQRRCHLERRRFTVLALHRRAGKALDVDTPIPVVAGGFKRMGDLVDGDMVFDENGKPCRVVHAHDVMHGRRCLEVWFSDGTSIVCDEDHLWHTQTKLDRANRVGRIQVGGRMTSGTLSPLPGAVKRAKEIEATLQYAGENNHSIALCGPLERPEADLPIDPYVLGAWLGDGHSSTSAFTTMDGEMVAEFRRYAEGIGCTIKPHKHQSGGRATTYQVSKPLRGNGDSMQARLRLLGVLRNKHIPSAYLNASVAQRKALFAGLMDTDGSISACGRNCEITLKRGPLVDGLMELMWSLGIKPGRSVKVVNGTVYERMHFTPTFNPFRLRRKAARYIAKNTFAGQRMIVAVNEVPSRPVRCITVDSESALYLCGKQCVPTHNTELALMELLHRAVKCTSDLGFFVYVAPFLKQAKAIAWARLKQRIDPFIRTGTVDVNEADLAVTFKHNKATIRLFGGDNPDALRGVRLDGCVIDEVAQIKPEVWEAIIQPALSDRRGWALFIGTPAGINMFSELYYRAASGSLEDWYAAKYTVYDTDALAPDEVKRLERDMPEAAFAREYLCDFSAAGDDQLISLSDAENAAQREYPDGDIIDQPLIVGVDPARFGDDRSVIVLRQGLRMEKPIVHHGIDNMALAAAVANVIEDRDPDAVFIDAGAGAGVIDRLRQLGYDVTEVAFGGKATYANLFINKRTEMWWAIREWIQAGGSIPNDITLKQEISTPIYWYDAAGKRVLESKDEIKKRLQGGGSPDMADALCLTFAYPVSKMLPREVREKIDTRPTDYDPYEQVSTRNR